MISTEIVYICSLNTEEGLSRPALALNCYLCTSELYSYRVELLPKFHRSQLVNRVCLSIGTRFWFMYTVCKHGNCLVVIDILFAIIIFSVAITYTRMRVKIFRLKLDYLWRAPVLYDCTCRYSDKYSWCHLALGAPKLDCLPSLSNRAQYYFTVVSWRMGCGVWSHRILKSLHRVYWNVMFFVSVKGSVTFFRLAFSTASVISFWFCVFDVWSNLRNHIFQNYIEMCYVH
jgi:hypothetical protein